MQTVLGTYNMSFASDKGYDYKNKKFISSEVFPPSEALFLSQHQNVPIELPDRRIFWKNALNHLESFIKDHSPLAVGLQEMNVTTKNSKEGTDAIEKMLDEQNKQNEQKSNYILVSGKVDTNNAGIGLIIDTARAGNVVHKQTVDNDNQVNGPNPKGGRPIFMVLTDKNYLFVSMHGAQNAAFGSDEDAFNNYMRDYNQTFLNETVTHFLADNNFTGVAGAYVMGDFNDRYDAIKDFDFGNNITLKYEGDAPKACCFNWDSMANESHHDKEKKGDNPQGIKPDPKVVETWDHDKLQTELKDHGNTINDYLNKGDKVFAYPHAGPLEIYDPKHNLNGVSQASDHELVFMTIADLAAGDEHDATDPTTTTTDPTTGGKRKTRRRRSTKKSKKTKKNTSKKSRKSKKTKKGRK